MRDVESEFEAASKVVGTESGYVVETATFEAVATVGADTVGVTVELPTLSAVVVDESVAEVVEDGWFETLERRLDGVVDVTPATVSAPTIERHVDSVVVTVEVTPRSGSVVDDVVAVVNFIEGTWVGGIIPGYEYVDRVAALRDSAAEMGGSDHTTQPD